MFFWRTTFGFGTCLAELWNPLHDGRRSISRTPNFRAEGILIKSRKDSLFQEMLFVGQTEKKNCSVAYNACIRKVCLAGSHPFLVFKYLSYLNSFRRTLSSDCEVYYNVDFFGLYNLIFHRAFLPRKPGVFLLSSGLKIVVKMKWTASERNVFVWTTTICLLHRFLPWLLWLMHARRFTGLISPTPRLILRLETVFADVYVFYVPY